ncbi:MAG: glycosyltransferase [Anaerolineae bacterium]|nr:glycosyltransferase [Anaerolineae bacterium]
MRILFITPQLPEPPHGGNALRCSGLMRGVHAAGHDIVLYTFGTLAELERNRETLESYCATIDPVPAPRRRLRDRLRDLLLTHKPDMERRLYTPLFVDHLKRLLINESFDLIQLEGLEVAVYLPVIEQCQPDTPVIYDAHNAEFDLQRSMYETDANRLRRLPGAVYSWLQWHRLARFERRVCLASAHVVTVSDADAEAMHWLTPEYPITVVPNGIDVQRYAQTDASLDLGPHALVFTGSMSYRPNVDAALWFADEILHRVRARVPDAKFFIVGSHPHRRLDTLRRREDVEITGWVPDVNPFLHAAAVYVAPLRMGSGTRLKLLQAMAAQQAIVSTTVGALGLNVQDGVELRLADDAGQFAEAVITLLENQAERQALGEAGANYVRAHHDWSAIVPRLLQVYDQVVGT